MLSGRWIAYYYGEALTPMVAVQGWDVGDELHSEYQ
jgi:hypothetical protein